MVLYDFYRRFTKIGEVVDPYVMLSDTSVTFLCNKLTLTKDFTNFGEAPDGLGNSNASRCVRLISVKPTAFLY